MASANLLANSIRKGQSALTCQLCEIEPKLKWKCIECNLLMCQRCRDKVHPKFRSAEDHKIIDLKEIGEYDNQSTGKIDTSKLKCKEHQGQHCLFCETCQSPVCPSCVTGSHRDHDLVEIEIKVENKFKFIRSIIKYGESKMKDLEKDENKLNELEKSEQQKYNKTREQILLQEKTIVQDVRKHSQNFVDRLESEWVALNQSILGEREQASSANSKLKEYNHNLMEILNANDASDILTFEYDTEVNDIRPPILKFQTLSKFVPNNNQNIETMFGSLQAATIPDKKIFDVESGITVVKQFEVENNVDKLLVDSNNSLWISSRYDRILLNINIDGKSPKVLSKFDDIYVFDMALAQNGDRLLSIENSTLSVLPSKSRDINTIRDWKDLSPLVTEAVCVTQNGDIILGAMDDGPHFPRTGTRQVIIFNSYGSSSRVIETDYDATELFTFPCRIASNTKNRIAIVDIISAGYLGRIVILDKMGTVVNIYTGHRNVNSTKHPFRPLDIAVTPLDNFIVTDYRNCVLHILDNSGKFLSYCDISNLNPGGFPSSVYVGKDSTLYVGYVKSKDSQKRPAVFLLKNPW